MFGNTGLSGERLAHEETGHVVSVEEYRICVCSATVGTSPGEISKACCSWAEDIGWHVTKNSREAVRSFGNSLAFSLYRPLDLFSVGRTPAEMKIDIRKTGKNRSRVSFKMDGRSGFAVSSRIRMCAAFARGVCSELASQGVEVEPVQLSAARQDRARLKSIVRWRRLLQLGSIPLGLLLIIVGIVVASIFDKSFNPLLSVPFLLAWLCLIVVLGGQAVRHWAVRASLMQPLALAVAAAVIWIFGLVAILFFS